MMGAFEDLIAGDIFNAIVSPFTTLVGADVLYTMLFSVSLIIIYMKTRSIGLLVVSLLLVGVGFISFGLVTIQRAIILLVVGSITIVFLTMFGGKR